MERNKMSLSSLGKTAGGQQQNIQLDVENKMLKSRGSARERGPNAQSADGSRLTRSPKPLSATSAMHRASAALQQDAAVCLPLCKLCSRDAERRPEIQLWPGRFSLSSSGPPTRLSDGAPV